MPPCFKARFGIKCLIKVPWHIIKHLAKAAFPVVFSAKQPLCREGARGGEGAGSVLDHTRGGGVGFQPCRTYCMGTPPHCALLALHPACLHRCGLLLGSGIWGPTSATRR